MIPAVVSTILGLGGVSARLDGRLAHPSNLSMAALRQLLLEPGPTKPEPNNDSIIPPVTGCDERLGLLASRGQGECRFLGYTGLKPKVYNSNKTQKVLSKFVKRVFENMMA